MSRVYFKKYLFFFIGLISGWAEPLANNRSIAHWKRPSGKARPVPCKHHDSLDELLWQIFLCCVFDAQVAVDYAVGI